MMPDTSQEVQEIAILYEISEVLSSSLNLKEFVHKTFKFAGKRMFKLVVNIFK